MIKYILLGIIQGLTEFLPVSSSGHLVIMQNILGITENNLAISIILHLGTTLALIIFFFKDILLVLRSIKLITLIATVTLITGIIGVSGKDFFEGLFSSPRAVGLALVCTGIILLSTKKFMDGKRSNLNFKDALILGITQGVAVIPGISRSGITISTLLFRKIDRETAFRFSFLVSIPAILGATLLEAREIDFALNLNLGNFIAGFIFSLFSGLFSLLVLKFVLLRAKLHFFGYYCILIAILTLIFIR